MNINSRYCSKFIQRFLVVVAIFILIVTTSEKAFAVSSLNGCFQSPACALELGLNVKPLTAAPIVQSATRTVAVEVLNSSGQVVANTTATVSRVTSASASSRSIFGRIGTALDIVQMGLSLLKVNQMQAEANKQYYQQNCTSSSTNAECKGYSYYDPTPGLEKWKYALGSSYVLEYNATYKCTTITIDGNKTDPNKFSCLDPASLSNGTRWQDKTDAQRTTAANSLPDSKYREILTKSPDTVPLLPSPIPQGATAIRIADPGDAQFVQDNNLRPAPKPLVISLNPNDTSDIDNDGQPDDVDTDDDNDGVSDALDPQPKNPNVPSATDYDGDGQSDDVDNDDDNDGIVDSNDPQPKNPSEGKAEIPTIDAIKPQEFVAKNWLEHGITVFSTKFPFDILGNLNAQGKSNECPLYTFFDYEFELCPIRDIISILKIPAIIAFLIWSFFSI